MIIGSQCFAIRFFATFKCSLYIHSLQFYQHLLANLITLEKLWKSGVAALIPAIKETVRKILSCMKVIAAHLGERYMCNKTHELLHIAMDVYWFGSSVCYSTGE